MTKTSQADAEKQDIGMGWDGMGNMISIIIFPMSNKLAQQFLQLLIL